MLSLTSDYRKGTGNPEPYLRDIAGAGFTHVHWCHQWNTDFLYTPSEIRQIGKWLKQYGLALLDLHGSVGPEKCWFSPLEHERRAGVELVKNRIGMAARLGNDDEAAFLQQASAGGTRVAEMIAHAKELV